MCNKNLLNRCRFLVHMAYCGTGYNGAAANKQKDIQTIVSSVYYALKASIDRRWPPKAEQQDGNAVTGSEEAKSEPCDHLNATPKLSRIELSSRTDRDVHALCNTMSFDLVAAQSPPMPQSELASSYDFLFRRDDWARVWRNEESDAHHQSQIRDFCRKLRFEMNVRLHDARHQISILQIKPLLRPLSSIITSDTETFSSLDEEDLFEHQNIRKLIKSRTYLYRLAIIHDNGYGCTQQCPSPKEGAARRRIEFYDCLNAAFPFETNRFGFYSSPFDIAKFKEAAQTLSGSEYDYAGFTNLDGLNRSEPRKSLDIRVCVHSPTPPSLHHENLWPYAANLQLDGQSDQSSTNRVVDQSQPPHLQLIDVYITARSFMYKMVRALIGCMADCATGRYPIEVVRDVRDRGLYYLLEKPFEHARPGGLYLHSIRHEESSYDLDPILLGDDYRKNLNLDLISIKARKR